MENNQTLRVLVDNRLRFDAAAVPGWAIDVLKDRFTHVNPQYGKLQALGYWTGNVPRFYQTWQLRGGEMSLPRGGAARLRAVLQEAGVHFHYEVRVCDGQPHTYPTHSFPGGAVLSEFQRDAVSKLIAKQNCVVRSPTGCITGDAIIGVNRGGKGYGETLEWVVRMHNGEKRGGRSWDPGIQTYVRAPFQDGTVRLARLIDARCSGRQEVFSVLLASGRSVSATCMHRFLTPEGWVPLIDLDRGSKVLVDGGIQKGNGSKPWYKLRVCRKHPFAGRRGVAPGKGGYTVPVHRLTAEARLNGMGLEDFVSAVEHGETGLCFLDPEEWVVHHKDENPHNNSPDNLEVLLHEEHRDRHVSLAKANIASVLVEDTVYSIKRLGSRMTYDLEVEEAEAFTANGVAVHNSGKTSMAIAAISQIGRTALVMVWTGALLKQWVERIEQELRIPRREIGVIGMGRKFSPRPITVAMQQTVHSLFQKGGQEAQTLIGYFGVLVCDELQRFAARTFIGAVDPFRCRYRLGFSADETRADGKEFLIYDEFGDVAVDIERGKLVNEGFILDVDVRVVPTEFEADWYHEEFLHDGQPNPNLHDFKRLLDEMCADARRNALVARTIAAAATEGGVMVFSHRVDHCQTLDRLCVQGRVQSGLMIGGDQWSHTFDETKDGLKAGRLRVGIGTFQAIGQAIDVPAVSRGVVSTPINNNRQMFGQVRGRMCRANRAGSTSAVLYYLWDRKVFGFKPLRNLMGWNNRVEVLDGFPGQWVPAADYIARERREASLFR